VPVGFSHIPWIRFREWGQFAERGSNINDQLVFGGTLESLTFWEQDFDLKDSSDTRLDTAKLYFEIQLNEWSHANLVFDYDPGTDSLFPTNEGDLAAVDRVPIRRGIITIGNIEKYPLYATFGRDDVPFWHRHWRPASGHVDDQRPTHD
jgi:hypothetical protein